MENYMFSSTSVSRTTETLVRITFFPERNHIIFRREDELQILSSVTPICPNQDLNSNHCSHLFIKITFCNQEANQFSTNNSVLKLPHALFCGVFHLIHTRHISLNEANNTLVNMIYFDYLSTFHLISMLTHSSGSFWDLNPGKISVYACSEQKVSKTMPFGQTLESTLQFSSLQFIVLP